MDRRWPSLGSTLATVLTIAIVDVPIRLIADRAILASAPFNPGITRIAGTVLTRFVEVAAVLIGLALLFRLTQHGSFEDLGLRRRGRGWLVAGFIGPVLALLLAALIASATGLLPVDRVVNPGPWPALLALAAATHAGWIEEIVFRGVLMQGIERVTNRPAAIVLSAGAFTALHLLAPFELSWAWWIIVAIAGLGFGWAFYASGRNLWLTIGLHWGFNLGVFLLLGLPGETRGWLHWPGSGQVPATSTAAGFVLIIAAVLTVIPLFLRLRKAQAQP